MAFLRFLTFSTLLFLGCAAPGSAALRFRDSGNKLVSISDRQTGIVYAIHASEPGALQFPNQGVTVSAVKDMKAEAQYKLEFDAVKASALNNMDSSFIATLSAAERSRYLQAKRNYKGGLRVPFLSFIGINLDDVVTLADMDAAANQANYDAKATAAKKIIESARVVTKTQTGKIAITGTTVIPVRVRAFLGLDIARVHLRNGKSIMVYASAGTSNKVPPVDDDGNGGLDIIAL